MKPVQSLQAFLLADASLKSARTFYTQVDNRYERLRSMNMAGYNFVTLGDEQFPHVPLFTLKNGIAISLEGNQSNVFGKFDTNYAVGNEESVKPVQIQLDNDLKVVNLLIYLCTGPQSFLPKMFVSSTTDTAGMTCSSTEIYFLSPAEVNELESVFEAETKTNGENAEEENTSEEYMPQRNRPMERTPEDILEERELAKSIFGGVNIY